MPYRVTDWGVTIECDTVEEVIALRQRVLVEKIPAGERRAVPERQQSNHQEPTDGGSRDFRVFYQTLPESSRLMLDALALAPSGMTTEALVAKLSIGTRGLPPLVKNLRRAGMQYGFRPEEIVVSQKIAGDPHGRSLYQLGDVAMKEMGQAKPQA